MIASPAGVFRGDRISSLPTISPENACGGGYIDDGAESKFGTHKELIVLNILKYKYCVK